LFVVAEAEQTEQWQAFCTLSLPTQLHINRGELMRKKYAVMSTIAAGSLAVTGVGVGTSMAASSAPKTHTLTFKSKTLVEKDFPNNRFVDADKDVAGGKIIGTDVLRGKFNVKDKTAKARVAAAFSGGFIYATFNIEGQGVISGGKVTGGTGKYAGVTGTITGHSISNNVEKVTITYQ
jgi:hypothetical protein